MTRSSDEQEIRNAVVLRLRELMPTARIVHELNVAGQGSNRIDVAAIDAHHIVGVEIKSRKDVLKRIDEQWKTFNEVCHLVIVAAHEKHFARFREDYWSADREDILDLNHSIFFGHSRWRKNVWRYPRPDYQALHQYTRTDGDDWRFDRLKALHRIPKSTSLLGMLWASELQSECNKHRISCNSRSTRWDMIHDMAWLMSGKEVAHAVCRQLRQRPFAEADATILPEPVSGATTAQPTQLSLAAEGTPA